ncbi:MAG: hypothetical protein JWR72_2643 [Flavisolibacter sp.]|jgi:hypothetical protein|nr:hypothetical protein [Flavisolibacter sp.]
MSERSTLLLLGDIENAIAKILLYTKDYTLADYKNDSKTKEAVERNFEINYWKPPADFQQITSLHTLPLMAHSQRFQKLYHS